MSITLHFASVAAARRDDRYDIDAKYSETAEGTKGSDATKIGVGAGAGHADAIVTPTDVSVVTRLLPTASANQWALVNEIRDVIPGAQVQLRERSLAWTRHPHAPKVRLVSALATVRVGLVLLRKEFHVPDSAPDVPARTQEDELMKA